MPVLSTADTAHAQLAGPPQGPVATPRAIAQIARGEEVVPVWVNQLGGVTFRVGEARSGRYVKWNPRGSSLRLDAEVARLRWAGRWVRVPAVLSVGTDDEGEWLVTKAVPGVNAAAARWHSDPERAVIAVGLGLRRFHDTLPVESCPFSWSAESRVACAQRLASLGLVETSSWHSEHGVLTVAEALEAVAHPPPVDAHVVCHGDACVPNTLLGDDGTFVGHVDVGQLGMGDRWADLAIASWSTEWNYGCDWTHTLLEAYGVDPDPVRLAYYRLLWELA